MNKRLILAFLFLFSVSLLWGQPAAESLDKMVERGLGRAGEQALILADNLKDKPEALPKTFEKGELKFTSYRGWVSGFFPGELWLLYEATGNADYKALAQVFTERVEPAKKMTSTHDLGFMLYTAATGTAGSAAAMLGTRYAWPRPTSTPEACTSARRHSCRLACRKPTPSGPHPTGSGRQRKHGTG